MGTGGTLSVVAGRLSYSFALSGPAMSVDTACSSSLVGTHLACTSLRQRECPAAAACGVNLFLVPYTTGVFSRAGMLSAEGRCKTLDATADGYARGEGCRTLLLESKSGVVSFAAVLGSAVNQDGRSSSLTAPNGPAQQDVMRIALGSCAPGSACELRVMELHGTGTPLGDPIELGAVAAVLLPHRTAPLTIQSAKSCIGHCETAAGVAGVMQLVAGLCDAQPTPLLHLRSPNVHVTSVLRLAAQSSSAAVALPRQASSTAPACSALAPAGGVSSFAFQGTNAHVLLGEGGEQRVTAVAPHARTYERRRQWAAPVAELVLERVVGVAPRVVLQARLGHVRMAYLWDHRVGGRAVHPAAGFLELAASAARAVAAGGAAAALVWWNGANWTVIGK
jgi:acyl transferase domain-containing protein